MGKRGKTEAAVTAPVAMVKTMDGKEVEPGTAMTLNRTHLVALARRARYKSTEAEQLGGLLQTYAKEGPMYFAVADTESEEAKQVAESVKTLANGYKPEGEAAPLWCPLEGAQKNWEEWKAQPSTTPKQSAEDLTAETEAARETQLARLREAQQKKDAERAAQEQKLGQAVGVLSKLVSSSVRDQRTAQGEREVQQEAIAKRLGPFVNGQAVLEWDPQTKRPVAIVYGNHRAKIVDFKVLAELVRDSVGPRNVVVTCEGCNKTETVGNMRPGKVFDRIEPVHEMTRLHVPAMRQDGKELSTHREGERQGQPRKFAIAVCRTCGGIAKRTCQAPRNSLMSVWTDNEDHALGTEFELWCERPRSDGDPVVASTDADGHVKLHELPVRKTRFVGPPKGPAGGPIGEAVSTGHGSTPDRHEEHFVPPPTVEESRINTVLADKLRTVAGVVRSE